MRKRTANLIIINDRNEVLLQLRDDKPTIPYPNMWTIPGGHIEECETPEECIGREMWEEMELAIANVHPFMVKEYAEETEIFFWIRADVDATTIPLTEGQAVRWFTREQVSNMVLAHTDGQVLEAFWNAAAAERLAR